MSDWHNEFRKALYWGAWRVKPDLSTEEKAEAFEYGTGCVRSILRIHARSL